MRKEAAVIVREQALFASPLNFGCDAAIFVLPRIVLDALGGVARIALELSKQRPRQLLVQ